MKNENKNILLFIGAIVIGILLLKYSGMFSISYGDNLVSNSGFETANGTNPASWIKVSTDSNHLAIWDNTIFHSGSKSLKMEVLNSSKSYYRWQGDDINVENGSWYYVEYWFKTENLPPFTGANATTSKVFFEWSEFDGINPNRVTTKALLMNWTEGNTGWTKLSANIKTGPTTVYISPRFFLYSYVGRAWFDDLVIKKVTETMENMTFEDYYWPGLKGVGIQYAEYDIPGFQEAGIKFVREEFGWTGIEKTKGVYDFSRVEAKVNQLAGTGIETLELIDYSNCLYSSMPAGMNYTCSRYVPTDPTEFEVFKKGYGEFCYHFVDYFKGRVKYFEMWNEPNGFWEPRRQDEAQALQYIELMKECYTRAKEANPNAIMVSAGLGTWDTLIDLYFRNFYAQGAKNYFDILAIHPYCNYMSSFPLSDQGKTCPELQNIAKIRSIMVANGDTNKKIWITEFGYPTAGCYFKSPTATNQSVSFSSCIDLNEENQNIRIRNVFPTLREEYPYVTGFVWHYYRDLGGTNPETAVVRRYDMAGCPNRTVVNSQCPIDIEYRFGLVRTDLSRRASYYTYKNLSNYQCIVDKCSGTAYYQCINHTFVNQGAVPEYCGVPKGSEEVPINTTSTLGGGGGGGVGTNETAEETTTTTPPITNKISTTTWIVIIAGVGIAFLILRKKRK